MKSTRFLFWIYIFLVLYFLVTCNTSSENSTRKSQRESVIRLSDTFFLKHKDEFLESDLLITGYNPRINFSIHFNDSALSLIHLEGENITIIRYYNLPKYSTWGWPNLNNDHVRIKQVNDQIAFFNSNTEKLETVIKTSELKINPFDYFFNLKEKVDKFKMLAIEFHPRVNTVKVIFSANDYLIYKPDSLIFKDNDTTFMKHLFYKGKKLNKNWYQFNDHVNTDYN